MKIITLITRFITLIFALDKAGPVDEFILTKAGKTYTFEDSSNDCQVKGGHVMVVNYEEVSLIWSYTFK